MTGDSKIARAVALARDGQQALAAGDRARAITALRRAVALAPMVEAYLLLGRALRDAADPSAVDAFRAAVALDPSRPDGHNSLGLALRQAGDPHGAVACFGRALALDPVRDTARFNLAATLAQIGDHAGAAVHYRELTLRDPGDGEAQNGLGAALEQLDRFDEALACYRAASAHPTALYNLGRVLAGQGALGEAELELGKLVALSLGARDRSDAHDTLAGVLSLQGRAQEAIAEYRRALAADPSRAEVHSNLLLAMQYEPPSADELFAEHRAWARAHGPTRPKPVRPDARAQLRIGFVSADLRAHSVAYFLEPVLAGLKGRAEVVVYCNSRRHDEVTRRLRTLATAWHEVAVLDDAALVAQVAGDGLDALLDLSGHTGGNRLRAIAGCPVPVVASYLGYPDTTGLALDYRITDALADPPGAESHHSERLLRLPGGFLCYRADRDSPPVTAPPSLARGGITFGSFNTSAKLGERVIAAWSSILARSDARLVLKSPAFGDPRTRERFLARFAGHGIAAERIELRGFAPSSRDHLASYADIDIALDPFPYHGTTTTCEALWMGVPVICLVGDRHAGRVGLSILSRLELGELCVRDEDAYVDSALALAQDRDRLVALRWTLRERMARSSLCDEVRIGHELEALLRAVCGKEGPSPLPAAGAQSTLGSELHHDFELLG